MAGMADRVVTHLNVMIELTLLKDYLYVLSVSTMILTVVVLS